ncbi:MAG: hypothetical protein U1E13_06115 [Methylophilaceae bacterium]|nr:hypothetical protein [Methylophilaceae bacterium]
MKIIKILRYPLSTIIMLTLIHMVFRPFSLEHHWLDFLNLVVVLMFVWIGWTLKRQLSLSGKEVFFKGVLIWLVIMFPVVVYEFVIRLALFQNATDTLFLLIGATVYIFLFTPIIGGLVLLGSFLEGKFRNNQLGSE